MWIKPLFKLHCCVFVLTVGSSSQREPDPPGPKPIIITNDVKLQAPNSNIIAGPSHRVVRQVGCGGSYSDDNGQIRHPYTGEKYADNENCIWTIQTQHPIAITFIRFDLEDGSDYLSIWDGLDKGRLLGKFTGDKVPGPVKALSNAAYLQFTSDFGRPLTGFELHWTIIGKNGECIFGGKSYANSKTLQNVCTKIWCNNGIWEVDGGLDNKCADSWVSNDPHFKTFAGNGYTWHGKCEYSITQEGMTYSPGYYVYGQFKECLQPWYGATCLDITTFGEPGSVFTLHSTAAIGGMGQVFTTKFNGNDKTLTTIPQLFGTDNAFIAWKGDFTSVRANPDCVCIVGSHGLMMQFCGWNMWIWATPSLKVKGSLYGLCGHNNGIYADDYTDRNGIVVVSTATFAESWKVPKASPCKSSRAAAASSENCEADTSIGKYRQVCADNIRDLDMAETDRNITIENCAFDRCIIIKSGSTDPSPADWLNQTRKSAERTVVIRSIEKDIPELRQPTTQKPTDLTKESANINVNVLVNINQP